MSAHHQNGSFCQLCEEKILTLDPRLQPWARHFKQTFPDGHLSWGFRDEENQNRFFDEGKTRARWPNSKHNRMDGSGKPAAQAFDLFRIRPDGVPEWRAEYCMEVWTELQAVSPQGLLEWAGNWTGFRELDHIQLKG